MRRSTSERHRKLLLQVRQRRTRLRTCNGDASSRKPEASHA